MNQHRSAGSAGRLAASSSGGRWTFPAHLQTLDLCLSGMFRRECRRLLVAMPPRHGKSELCSKFLPAWFLSRLPDLRVVLTSYNAQFAESWGRKTRALFAELGGQTSARLADDSRAAGRWDIARHAGGMVAAGVGGTLTGRGADLLIVDDPVKNAEEALSRARLERTWDWWESTALTRLEPKAWVIVMQTRWHEEDLAGRLIAQGCRPLSSDVEFAFATSAGKPWRLVAFPALAQSKDDSGRPQGGALWPERWPAQELAEIRDQGRAAWWSSLYQQQPVPPHGAMFAVKHLAVVHRPPDNVERAVRYWDRAASAGCGDYTAGVLMLRSGGRYVVADVVRGQWRSAERDRLMRHTAESDRQAYGSRLEIWIEQEPGSSGKDSVEATVRDLAGYRVRAERPTGSKVVRADPFAAQVEAGSVALLYGSWNQAYRDELASFPLGAHDDQVDASSGAFLRLADRRREFVVHVR